MALGERLRELRRRRRLTLAQLALRANLTPSMLSQIERGLATPSLATLQRIAVALPATFGQLFEEVDLVEWHAPPGTSPVVHESQRKVLTPNDGVIFQMLNADPGSSLKMLLSIFAPGASTGDEPYAHLGLESGLVLEGVLEIRVGEETYHLAKGDSITFSAAIPHRKHNTGNTQSVSIWAISPFI